MLIDEKVDKKIYDRYLFFVYCVLRDALGSYLGIQTFLKTCEEDYDEEFKKRLKLAISKFKTTHSEQPTEEELTNIKKSTELYFTKRKNDLKRDLRYCEAVLFEDNLWLDWLQLDKVFFKNFIRNLSEEQKRDLEIVPKWNVPDCSLGRSFLNKKEVNFQDERAD